MAPAVAVRDLRVRRAGTLVLDGLSLDIEQGRVTGLLGPNGAGKSTLIRAIVGVQIVEGGTVTVLGRRGRLTRAPCPGRLRDAGAVRLPRSERA